MRAIIVEDEVRSQSVLENMLRLSCKEISIIGSATSVTSGCQLINELHPELIFMDVQLTDGTGFDILKQIKPNEAHIIFTTAYDQYAIKAFRYSAMDYLIKPIDMDELVVAVQKCLDRSHYNLTKRSVTNLLHNYKLKQDQEPILSISTVDSILYLKINNIIRCEATGSYSNIYHTDRGVVLISKVIKELEHLLSDYSFCRVHQSHLVNLKEVVKYIKKDNLIEMSDGSQIPLSRSRRESFFQTISKHRI